MPFPTQYPRVNPTAPIIALDIDGTLGDYYHHFIWFAELYTQRKITADWTKTCGEFSEALGMEKAEYRAIKLAYRQGGMKRCLPVLGNVHELVQGIRNRGVRVWIASTRPYNRLDNIDPDTQFWISLRLGRVDGVSYGEEKFEDLIDIVGKGAILGVADDLPENIERANALGLPSILRAGPHNRWWTMPEDQRSAQTTHDLSTWAHGRIDQYINNRRALV